MIELETMRYVLFTDKTVAQCLRDLNERLQAKGTKTNPELGGWIDKKGAFALTVTSKVFRRFSRKTRLTGQINRDSGTTVIRGYVSDGVSPEWMRIMAIGLLIISGALAFSGQYMVALMVIGLGLVAYIPLRGDYLNSDTLLIAVEKTLKATPKPPKK
jgi:hypothetical protein